MAKNTDKNQDKSLIARHSGTLSASSVESVNALLNLREKVKQNTALVSDEWLDRLIKWADENKIPDYLFPKDREKLRVAEKIVIPDIRHHYIKTHFIDEETRVQYFKGDYNDDIFDDTGLRQLPDELENLCFLKTLFIEAVVDNFSGDIRLICRLKTLKSLSLNGTYFKKNLPNEFANLQNLEYLWLNEHGFKELPNAIIKLNKLKYISLNQGSEMWFGKIVKYGLSSLPDEFANLQNLAMVSLLGNNFARFPQVLFDLPKLEYLWIDEYLITPSIAKELQRKGVQVHYE